MNTSYGSVPLRGHWHPGITHREARVTGCACPGINAGATSIFFVIKACKHCGLERSQLFRSICGRRV
jgi:hypothetical protein